jgi:hypothetical protein
MIKHRFVVRLEQNRSTNDKLANNWINVKIKEQNRKLFENV